MKKEFFRLIMKDNDRYRRRKRTLGCDDRGQTLQDFILGIGLFIVTVTFVLGLFPSFLSPFTTGAGGEERAQADRVAGVMVLNLSTDDGKTTLNVTELNRVLQKSQPELRERYGLPETSSVNITVRELDGDRIVQYGGSKMATAERRQNQSSESSARVITIDERTVDRSRLPAGTDSICRPGCRLIVRVW